MSRMRDRVIIYLSEILAIKFLEMNMEVLILISPWDKPRGA